MCKYNILFPLLPPDVLDVILCAPRYVHLLYYRVDIDIEIHTNNHIHIDNYYDIDIDYDIDNYYDSDIDIYIDSDIHIDIRIDKNKGTSTLILHT